VFGGGERFSLAHLPSEACIAQVFKRLRWAGPGRLLTICSQTVRIHPDVAAHVWGKHARQAHSDVHSWT
jgi:hypothetical protein